MYNKGSRRQEGREREAQNSGEQRHQEVGLTSRQTSEVGEMSTSVLVEGHSITGTAALPIYYSYPTTELPYARTEQNP